MTIGSGESKLEAATSFLLIVGVAASVFLEITGIIMFYYSYGNLHISQDSDVFLHGQNLFSFIYQGGHTQKSAFLFITAGVVVLMLTPYIRVIASALYFAWKKNIKYVMITLFVLIVLTVSLALH